MSPSEVRTETLRRFNAWKLAPNEHLPLIESLRDLKPKTSAQVAARAVAAGYLVAVCFGASQEKVRLDLERFSLWQHLSIEEQTLFASEAVSEQSKALHRWLIEAIHFMAWSLGLAPLDHFAPCSETLASLLPKAGTDPTQFITSQNLRPIGELLQEADTLYMLHWFAVEANLNGQLNRRVVLPQASFRRHAADWIIGVAEAWDDVSLDT